MTYSQIKKAFSGKQIVTKTGQSGTVVEFDRHFTRGAIIYVQREDGTKFATFTHEIAGVMVEVREVIGYTLDLSEIKN